MKKQLADISKYCIENNIEINFDEDGISLWTTGDGPALKISDIKAGEVKSAVNTLNKLRAHGWITP